MDRQNEQLTANALWYWVSDKLRETNWDSRCVLYDQYFDYYRGRQWEQETTEYQEQFAYKPTYNEIGAALTEHVAHILKGRPRHYHINADPNIMREQRAINMFLTRITAKNYWKFRRDALMYAYIYGSATLELGIEFGMPYGFKSMDSIPDLAVPVYRAAEPWRWVFDPSGYGDPTASEWAFKFFVISKGEHRALTGRDVSDTGGDTLYRVMDRFCGRTTATHSIRGSEKTSGIRNNIMLGCDIYFKNTEIGEKNGGALIKSSPNWKMARIVGNTLLYFNTTNDPSLDNPIGQDVGIPAVICNPMPLPGFQHGMSFIQRGMDIQKDINARRARAAEIEQFMSGVFTVSGPNASKYAQKIRKQRGTGVIDVPSGVKLDRLRGEKADINMYNQVDRANMYLQKLVGVPPILTGANETGSYSSAQTNSLIDMASVLMNWRVNEFGMSLGELGDKEWSALKHFWHNRTLMMDSGFEAAIIDSGMIEDGGWVSETVPEQLYVQMITSDQQEVKALFLQGLTDPITFYSRVFSMTPEEKERSINFLTQRMESENAQAEPAAAAGVETQ